MVFDRTSWAACGSTLLFVLLWGSGAIFARLGLDHASPFAFLVLRFALACAALLLLASLRGRWLPAPGQRRQTLLTGLLMIGGYTICYLLALDRGLTPGVLATVLGVQPILTLALLERRFAALRLVGLGMALGGLGLVVNEGLQHSHLSAEGMLFALAALACMTLGAIRQKGQEQAPMAVLPLQYGVSLLACVLVLPFQPWQLRFSLDFLVPLLWMALVISVAAQLLLYRLIRAGNLVDVTSLFYLVPVVTAAMDYLILGNRLSTSALGGMLAILLGLLLVFRFAPRQ